MQRSGPENNSSQRLAWAACLLSGVLMVLWIAGCGTNINSSPSSSSPSTKAQQTPQSYFAPIVSGAQTTSPQTFIFDDVAKAFSQETFALLLPQQVGPQVLNVGTFTASQRGLLSLGISTSYSKVSSSGTITTTYNPTTYSPPETGSFALELPGQAGGLVQLVGQPVEPIVAATQCPSFTSAQTYQFVTIPGSGWNAMTDTAYGSVDIASSGSTVRFQNIDQHTLPSVGGTGKPTQPGGPSATGVCGPTTLGNVIGIPGQYIVTAPGAGGSATPTAPPQAAVGIGATGLLVEDNGSNAGGTLAGTLPQLSYENVLGAGTGAVGLPKPSSALDTGALVGAQYLGFIYGTGKETSQGTVVSLSSSHLASFGFSGSLPSSCPSVVPSTSTPLLYGGDFPQQNGQDNPSASPDGFGHCDFVIDLGTQDDNGLYTHGRAWVGAGYAGNSAGGTYFFPAVAIAGQLNGQYAIFLVGADSAQPWAIYLLQSNSP